jgi:hypothetical protein
MACFRQRDHFDNGTAALCGSKALKTMFDFALSLTAALMILLKLAWLGRKSIHQKG